MTDMRVLAIDPGETSGWAYQDGRDDFPGGLIDLGQKSGGLIGMMDLLEDWNLETRPIDALVIEDYTIYDAKANMGTKGITIGVKDYARAWGIRKGIKIQMYPSSQIPIVAKITGMDPRKGAHKNTHWAYAANYGRYYLIKTGNAKSALQLAKAKS